MAENVSITIRAFDKTKKGFGSATKGIASIAKSVVSLRSALILVGGAAGFGYMVKSSLNATDALKKTADKIGTTTAALGGLRYAAQITGVATNTMDMALQRFTRRTAEAAKGTGEAKGAIKELGINAKELNRMPLDERMLVLADAFGGVSNESDKLRLAFKLFDSEGAALVNTLSLGRDGLKDLLGEAKALGLTMSNSAAVGVEKANDAVTKLLSLGKGLKDQFSAALAPAIELVTTRITEFFAKIAKDEGGVEKWARGMAVSFIEAIGDVIRSLDTGLTAIAGFMNKANQYLNGFETKSQENRLERLVGKLSEVDAEIKALQAGGKKSASDWFFSENLEDKKNEWESLSYQIILTQEELQKLGSPIAGNGLSEFFDKTLKDLEGLAEAVKGGGQDGGGIFKPLIEDLSDVRIAFKEWSDAIPDMDVNIQSLTKQGLNGLTDALAAGVTGAANFADAMKAMAKSVIDSLIKMLIQKYIVDAAFGAITGYFGGGGTGSTGSGMTSGGGVGMGQMYSNTAAIGGPVVQGERTLVGERGPEIFVPNASGSIIPNNKLGGGGVTINQTINVTTGIQSTVRAEIVGLMPQIAQAAKGAVADARVRGGNFSKAMVGA
tara:strand:+ start:4267 stop:6099 length:1833 start_codon:yes stop_codon:yes gene_type:complete